MVDPTERPEQLRVRVQTSKTNPTADRATSPHTRRAYAMARRQLDAWLAGRPLDASSLAAYLGHLHEAGRAPETAAMVVATVELTARGASTHAIQLAGGWKDPAMVVRYAASVSTREGAVSKYLR